MAGLGLERLGLKEGHPNAHPFQSLVSPIFDDHRVIIQRFKESWNAALVANLSQSPDSKQSRCLRAGLENLEQRLHGSLVKGCEGVRSQPLRERI